MGLFKEFKDDFSQAVNELVPGDVPEKEVEPKAQTADNLVVEPIVEILAEGVLAHGFLKVLVRRGDDAHRHRTARLPADAGHLAVLEQAQERNLRVHRHLAELVEKNGPAVRKPIK